MADANLNLTEPERVDDPLIASPDVEAGLRPGRSRSRRRCSTSRT